MSKKNPTIKELAEMGCFSIKLTPKTLEPQMEDDPMFILAVHRRADHVELKKTTQRFFDEREQALSDTFSLLNYAINNWMTAQGFWESRNIAEKLMLVTTEVAEAVEGHRHGDMQNFGEELADIVIRVMDIAGELEVDLGREIVKKMRSNLRRPRKHGKAY